MFCEGCIKPWLNIQDKCPIDREPLMTEQLQPAPRVLKSLLDDLQISCDFSFLGCQVFVRLEGLDAHKRVCKRNPELIVKCGKGCGAEYKVCDEANHFCSKYLTDIITNEETKINILKCADQLETKDITTSEDGKINELKRGKEETVNELEVYDRVPQHTPEAKEELRKGRRKKLRNSSINKSSQDQAIPARLSKLLYI
jgi:hypothetical protein